MKMSTRDDIDLREWNPKYSEFVKRESEAIEAILAKKGVLATYKGQSSFHMGSTAIKGMIGKPVIDMTILTTGLLPNIPNDVIEEMEKLGYWYAGPAHHTMSKHRD